MAGPSIGDTRWSLVVSVLVAAAMAAIAVLTVQQAGCQDPGHYVAHDGGYELVGGCLESTDLHVGPDTGPAQPAPAPDLRSPYRP